MISGFPPNPRLELAYSPAYYNAGQVLLVSRTAPDRRGLGDLRGKIVAVELGSDADEWLKRQRATGM